MIVFVNGDLVPQDRARVSPLDRGVLVGLGVFETLRANDGVPFALRRHMERLRGSAETMGIVPPGDDVVREAVTSVLAANALADARIRITLTAGPGEPGRPESGGPPTLIVTATPVGAIPPNASVVTTPWARNERGALTGIKSTSAAEGSYSGAYAAERGAHEAVLPNTRGNLCEGATSNVFLVEEGRVVTPPVSSGCLPGVTRTLVLSLCTELGIGAAEEDRPLHALSLAAEAFLTSSVRGVLPIALVDEHPLPAAPGPLTTRIARAYRDLVRRDPEP